jgi:uncharacterized BrkB/YihY/UPF0761 family membrane protein
MTIDIVQEQEHSTTPKTFKKKLQDSTDTIVLCLFISSIFTINAMTALHNGSFQCIIQPQKVHYCTSYHIEIMSLLCMNIVFTILLTIPFVIAIAQQWQDISLLEPDHYLSKIIFEINHMLFGYCIICWFTNNWMIFLRSHPVESYPILRILIRYTIIQDVYMFLYTLFFNLYHYRQQTIYEQEQVREQYIQNIENRTLDAIYTNTETEDREPSRTETISFVFMLVLIGIFFHHTTRHFRI